MRLSIAPAARAVIFDAYGTLFDVHSAVARHAERIGPEAARLSEIWRSKQLEYSWVLSLASRYEPFWLLTERALAYAFARCPSVDRTVGPLLLDAYRRLDCYPEVPALLDALRREGLQTGTLSNGDPQMLREATASAGLGGRLDAVLSVEAVKTFKTSPQAYELVITALSMSRSDIVFVSSNRWDIAGAAAFGFTSVWVNRLGLPDEYPGLEPVAVATDLTALLPA
jgi:2-haloacid dehalogenase